MSGTNTTNICPTVGFFLGVIRLLDDRSPGRMVTGGGDTLDQIRRRLGEVEALFATLPMVPKPEEPTA